MEDKEFLKDNKIYCDFTVLKWAFCQLWKLGKGLFVFSVIFYATTSILPVWLMSVSKDIMDDIQREIQVGSKVDAVIRPLLLLVSVMLLQAICNMVPKFVDNMAEKRYRAGFQKEIGYCTKQIPVRYFDDAKTSKTIEIMQGRNKNLGWFYGNLMQLLTTVVTFISCLILAFQTSWYLLVAAVVFLAIVIPISLYCSKIQFGFFGRNDEERLYGYYNNLIFNEKNAKEIRLFRMGDYIIERWKKLRKIVVDREQKSDLKVQLIWDLVGVLFSVVKFVVLFSGLYLVRTGNLTLGGLTLFVSLFLQISDKSTSFGRCLLGTSVCLYCVGQCKAVFDLEFEEREPIEEEKENLTREQTPVFECKNVWMGYN